jgi:hypothetical protein
VTLKGDTLFIQGVQSTKGNYLKTTTVGQEVAVPVHEFVETTLLVQNVFARLEEEMIGVRKHDVTVNLLVKG